MKLPSRTARQAANRGPRCGSPLRVSVPAPRCGGARRRSASAGTLPAAAHRPDARRVVVKARVVRLTASGVSPATSIRVIRGRKIEAPEIS